MNRISTRQIGKGKFASWHWSNPRSILAVLSGTLAVSCIYSDFDTNNDDSGVGSASMGGTAANGGTHPVGGASAVGGSTRTTTAGTGNAGGIIATGGSQAAGGGRTPTGGVSFAGGTVVAGGTRATGGVINNSGGVTSNGGAIATGGTNTTPCPTGFADCNANPADGCEVNLTADPNHCGSCSTVCAFTNATPLCMSSACALGQCNSGFADCDGIATNGCEVNLNFDINNCRACGAKCPTTGGTPVCNSTNGCGYSTCAAGLVTCPNGTTCGTNVTTDVSNCGTCNNVCNATNGTATCASGQCSIKCASGYGNCDVLVSNGCETNLSTSPQSCGTCGMACAPANATGACSGGSCSMGTCNTWFANCNALVSDGCEVNLTSDPNHCNSCSTVCSFANAVAGCNSGVCTLGTCNAGYGNCDGSATNGCEVNLKTDPAHCNSCSTVCAYTNASATCSNGACSMGTCSAGFANCDGTSANGCEINLNSDINNCGTCGSKCPTVAGTASCSGGVCGSS